MLLAMIISGNVENTTNVSVIITKIAVALQYESRTLLTLAHMPLSITIDLKNKLICSLIDH
jgi:hypothetical protein